MISAYTRALDSAPRCRTALPARVHVSPSASHRVRFLRRASVRHASVLSFRPPCVFPDLLHAPIRYPAVAMPLPRAFRVREKRAKCVHSGRRRSISHVFLVSKRWDLDGSTPATRGVSEVKYTKGGNGRAPLLKEGPSVLPRGGDGKTHERWEWHDRRGCLNDASGVQRMCHGAGEGEGEVRTVPPPTVKGEGNVRHKHPNTARGTLARWPDGCAANTTRQIVPRMACGGCFLACFPLIKRGREREGIVESEREHLGEWKNEHYQQVRIYRLNVGDGSRKENARRSIRRRACLKGEQWGQTGRVRGRRTGCVRG